MPIVEDMASKLLDCAINDETVSEGAVEAGAMGIAAGWNRDDWDEIPDVDRSALMVSRDDYRRMTQLALTAALNHIKGG